MTNDTRGLTAEQRARQLVDAPQRGAWGPGSPAEQHLEPLLRDGARAVNKVDRRWPSDDPKPTPSGCVIAGPQGLA